MFWGIGTNYSPFQNKESSLNGLYFGLCVGLSAERAQVDETKGIGYLYSTPKEELDIFDNTFFLIEVGYDFWIGKSWRIGTALSYSFAKYGVLYKICRSF
ncbi:hypothetical protein [Fibrobacter sp.]|uniref:hypothetical protein n=1 Tax=Fibrobacter sp. TaxID=35828 RepID=UPI00388D00E7